MSKLVGINEGDVVRVKFRSIHDITKDMKMTPKLQYMDDYDIGANINALMLGGDFVVVSVSIEKNTITDICIDNHFDGDTFTLFEDLLESIEVIEVSNKFISEEHGIAMIQVADKIYINGRILENDLHTKDEALNKFKAFMEAYIVAQAFEDSLDGPS